MTVGGINGASLASQHARADARRHMVGDQVNLKVVRRLDERRYLASFRDAQHVVDSTIPLAVGSTVRATVTAIGEKLELRYVSADAVVAAMQEHEAASEDALAELAARYGIDLREENRATIEQAMMKSANPTAMASAGMFLSKLSLPVEASALQSVYAAQIWGARVAVSPALAAIHDVAPDRDGGIAELSRLIGTVLDQAAQTGDSDSGPIVSGAVEEQVAAGTQSATTGGENGHGESERGLAQRLLNEQDEGSLAYHYGVLPVLIDDQLVELDLVYFRERNSAQAATGVRRLVMTFQTPTFGRIEVLAQALGDRLSIDIKTESTESKEVLATHASRVRELASRLGWNVESMSYDVDVHASRAARHVIDHVLNADTLSRLV